MPHTLYLTFDSARPLFYMSTLALIVLDGNAYTSLLSKIIHQYRKVWISIGDNGNQKKHGICEGAPIEVTVEA